MTRLNLDIRPDHVRSGAAATKRSRERSKRLQATTLPTTRSQPSLAPFARSAEAVSCLTQALGYPPAVIPPLKPSRIHKAIPDEDEP